LVLGAIKDGVVIPGIESRNSIKDGYGNQNGKNKKNLRPPNLFDKKVASPYHRKWKTKYFNANSFLVMSLMHPISWRLPTSAKTALNYGLTKEETGALCDMIRYHKKSDPEKLFCLAMYSVEAGDATFSFMDGYGLGNQY
jgi:hypothetical protein